MGRLSMIYQWPVKTTFGSRWIGVFWTLAVCVLVSSCASQLQEVQVVRTPLKSFSVSPDASHIPIALLDVVVVPPAFPPEAERRLLSVPDEVLVSQDEGWVFVPSLVALPVTDILLVSLRHAGLR